MSNIPADDPRAIALVQAIRTGNVTALQQQLRDDPALVSSRIVDDRGVGRTLLHVAADWPGHVPNVAAIAGLLIACGASPNATVAHPTDHGSAETPLHWAASSDDVALIDALLEGGADLEAPGAVFTGGSPLSDAVVFGQWNAAYRLLERGARTTLWQAAALGLLDRVREYCDTEPPPSPRDVTNAFWNACRGGQLQVAAYLLERGADLNWRGHDRKTPLDVADESKDRALIDWLRARGARRRAELG